MDLSSAKIGVIGLGYVGLPLALAFARKFPGTVGFDIDKRKVDILNTGRDVNDEGMDDELKRTSLVMTTDPAKLMGCNFFVVGVPTPVDENRNPDLGAVLSACKTVGSVISKGSIVVFESTVYPGVTEELCGPRLEEVSGLKWGVDFKLGYSPERINPGDSEHSLERVTKVVSGEDPETLETVAAVYGAVVEAGVYRAQSIRVAEAAKVIENTQRDLNIALMNELAIIFDRLGISTKQVLDAASTKWNFLRFNPGLVGGHCIGVDPYYLTMKAEQVGYHPQVILAGRRINDGMGTFIAQRAVKLMVCAGLKSSSARIGILGLTFKENVTDLRNSRVPDIARELREFGIDPLVYDPNVSSSDAEHEYGLKLSDWSEIRDLDVLILAVGHKQFMQQDPKELASLVKKGGIFMDIKSVFDAKAVGDRVTYWSL